MLKKENQIETGHFCARVIIRYYEMMNFER